ncbi:AraC family transcriptional regulator [Vibrio diazotrophicus]|uniref:AraC family transcriptional regulator n=1 Tax=Vibrio diazotrophicus TaxID=685 RepID=A0A2J8GIK4_VIBDI|nr:helix-turn-helix domain-containing protein [Vibrio diazotrophicus]PNH85861.1 AraC family transcriptional regulator [Vibrio diazotrophicus]RAS60942.1 AraC family transcriptional regulator [Vibrio diazotrophicus]
MNRSSASFQRVCKLLNYIHSNMEQAFSLDELAQQSCWSRWQLQRVFQSETGISVAHYVREIKLSAAAESLLAGSERIIDIAIGLGFSSEMSFSRAFKQHFGVSPRVYRKQGKRYGLRKPLLTPISLPTESRLETETALPLIEVRVETTSDFDCYGVMGEIRGLFSPEPNFSQQVPKLWARLYESFPDVKQYPLTGVVDVTGASSNGHRLRYLAGVTERLPSSEILIEKLIIPTQTYAVIKHKGPISGLAQTLEWFIFHWLPQSDYRGEDGFELERYPQGYDCQDLDAEMEYWLPVSPVTGS